MMKQCVLLYVFIFIVAKFPLQAQSVNAVTPLSTSVGRFEKFEASVALTANFTNPYDYDQVVLRGVFTAPSGRRDTIEGFYLQDFDLNTASGNLNTKGAGEWRVRFSPNEVGTWQYAITVSAGGNVSAAQTGSFTCSSSAAKGFVRRNTTNYLNFDNGEQYVPVGQNLCWPNGNPYNAYRNWLDKMGAAKANFMRLWLCHWGLGIEWKKDANSGYDGLRRYKQNNSWYIDWLLEKCRELDIYVMFCINHHGQVSTQVNPNWSDSPYNTDNGGMCAQTWNFFNNFNAKQTHKNRLRYIVARWGYSRNIMTWELFNEVNWTDSYGATTVKTDVRTWHDEMATYLRQIDPHKHLVSTSFGKDEDPLLWQLPNMDYTQTHNYLDVANIEKSIVDEGRKFVQDYQKPLICGEFGINVGSGSGTSSADPRGVHLHNVMWATALSGALGAGATWWWDSYTEPQNLYGEFAPLSTFLKNVPLYADNFKPAEATVSGGSVGGDLSVSPSGDWGQATEANFTVSANGISAGRLGQYLYGSQWNTQLRNPPTFNVSYPAAGKFTVKTGGQTGQAPNISIYLNGNLILNTPAAINQTYTVNVPAGNHTLKVDNLGTDWIRISEYIFVGMGGAPVNTYVLKSSNSAKTAGWIHNRRYNWKELPSGTPPSVNGASVSIPNVANGTYDVKFYSCTTGLLLSSASVNSVGTSLTFALPNLPWDVAFTANRTGTVRTNEVAEKPIAIKLFPNPVRAGGTVTLDTEGLPAGKWQINLYNLSGQLVQSESADLTNAQTFTFTLRDAPRGLYILNLTNGEKAAVAKLQVTD